MMSRCSTMFVEGIFSFFATTSCRGFIVRPIATAGLLSLTDIYAKASRTGTVRIWSATCGLVSDPHSPLARLQRSQEKKFWT